MSLWDCLKNKDGRPKTEVRKYNNPEITSELRYELEKLFSILEAEIVCRGYRRYPTYLDLTERVKWYSEKVPELLITTPPVFYERPKHTDLDYKKLKCRFGRSQARVIMLRRRITQSGIAYNKAIGILNERENDLKSFYEEKLKDLKEEVSRLETENSVLREGKEKVIIIRELPPRS